MKAATAEQAMEAVLAYELAMDTVLAGFGWEYGNLMEYRMVVAEVADEDAGANRFMLESDEWLRAAKAAAEAARTAVLARKVAA